MKLSSRTRYSIRLMTYLGDHSQKGKPVSLAEIAKEQELSVRYLEQLVVPLKNAGLLKSVAGKYGGYFLTKPANQIYIAEIIEAVDGGVKLIDCVSPKYPCSFQSKCRARRMWGLINIRITDVLYDYTLLDLSEIRPNKTVGAEVL